MGATTIEWTQKVWNPLKGCSLKSPGCIHCYAMRQAPRTDALSAGAEFVGPPGALTKPSKNGPVFTGQVRFIESKLLDPLDWKKPKSIFVNSMSDLFHEDVPDEWIDRIFAVMALAPQHRFQVLTKRADRMRDYCKTLGRHHEVDRVSLAMKKLYADTGHGAQGAMYRLRDGGWHFPNIWLGVSVEDQQRADERIPILLDTPAAVRWISAEPLLGPIDVLPYLFIYAHADDAQLVCNCDAPLPFNDPATTKTSDIATPRLDWVVAGGESGHHARPMHPDWARALRDQCAAAGVPFFFKQWGEYGPAEMCPAGTAVCSVIASNGKHLTGRDAIWGHPEDEGAEIIGRFGKAVAGRQLDGIEHNAMPEIRA